MPYKKIINANTNGFDKRPEDARKGGRRPSISKEIKKMLSADGLVRYKASSVAFIRIDGDLVDISGKDVEVGLKIPKKDALAQKLVSWAMSKRGTESLKALDMLMDRTEGKAKSSMEIVGEIKNKVITESEEELLAEIERLKKGVIE